MSGLYQSHKLFNTSLMLALSLTYSTLSFAHQTEQKQHKKKMLEKEVIIEQEVMVEKKGNADQIEIVKVDIDLNGKAYAFDISPSVIKSPVEREQFLKTLPEEVRSEIATVLNELDKKYSAEHKIKILKFDDNKTHELHEHENVFVLDSNDGKNHKDVVKKIIIKDQSKVEDKHVWIESDNSNHKLVSVIKRLIEKSELTKEDVAELKTLLDKK